MSDLSHRLLKYRPHDEWGEGVHHMICDEAAAALDLAEVNKNAAYAERNQLVAALSKIFPSGQKKTAIEGWDEAWHNCIYIELPTGQVSWHIHDREMEQFSHLPRYYGEWDGHDTPEKYRRLAALRSFQEFLLAPQDTIREGLPIELDGISDELENGKGMWRTCSGCHENNEGHPTGPYSSIMRCHLGGGCFECGGIGAIWDTTDYEDFGNFLAAEYMKGDPEVRIAFGLGAQGHIPAVEAALSEGVDWQEIGRRIGWDGETARQYYERHLAQVALATTEGQSNG